MRKLLLVGLVLLPPTVAAADEDAHGTLNPDELSVNSVMAKAIRGRVGMADCAQGYHITKAGRHADARTLFLRCVDAGYTGAMTWMAQLDDNGLGGPEDPEAAAAWDRRAAEAGDPVGQFNYGLDLLRGRGVARNGALGRQYIDRAAAGGLTAARALQAAGYDLDVVTPDADSWKYDPRLY